MITAGQSCHKYSKKQSAMLQNMRCVRDLHCCRCS